VPLDDTIMDNLYNLALDFERKRQSTRRIRIPLHGRPQPEVPRSRSEVVACQADVGNPHSRRRADSPGGTLVPWGAEKPMLGAIE